jgi:tetratricopeptide (TPR) repeat protein
MAIDNNDVYAMNNLGNLYKDLKDYTLAIFYYKMAINYNCVNAMFNLGHFYYDLKDYDSSIIYYKMAINNNNVNAMYNLGNLYEKIKDFDNAIIYYKMAFLKNMFNINNPIYKYQNSINYINEDNDNCVICLELLDNTTIVYNCLHKIHYGCHLQLTVSMCPLCRASI